jgi:hypothetical protein
VYVIVARRAGVCSGEASSDTRARPTTTIPPGVRPSELPPPVGSLVLLPYGKRVRLVYPTPPVGRVEVRRLPAGVRPPAPGSVVPDPASCGEVVPGMGAGLAVDRRPTAPTGYVALTIDGAAVAGAATWYLELPPVTGLRAVDGLLRWDWPAGCTEVMVVWRTDAPPEAVGDPAAGSRKVTNTRYRLDGGFALPSERPLHVAAFTCTRMSGALAVASGGVRLTLG